MNTREKVDMAEHVIAMAVKTTNPSHLTVAVQASVVTLLGDIALSLRHMADAAGMTAGMGKRKD
jgi:hypothetical protein